ncbi:MAG: hypothetical protein U0T36_11645 [Saprospiraceae bacterium]
MISVICLVLPCASVNDLLLSFPWIATSVPFLKQSAKSSAVLPQAMILCQSVCLTFSPVLLV